jgi:hypothetical protein
MHALSDIRTHESWEDTSSVRKLAIVIDNTGLAAYYLGESTSGFYSSIHIGTRGSVVVKELCRKPDVRGF